MPRTPEQVEADDALTAAIERVIEAYRDDDESPGRFVLSEYVVLSASQGWDDDGVGVTATASLPRDGDVPIHRLLGLVEYAAARYRKTITDD